MRFTWFNLMPWPYLPDDFRIQQFHAIGESDGSA
jgi:hypothetical protein